MRARAATRRRVFPVRHAFTLIEVILAIGVAAVVLLAINAVFFAAMRLRASASAAVEQSIPVEQALTVIRRDLAGAVPPSTNGILAGSFKVGNVTSLGLSQPVEIELYTTTGALRDDQPWAEIQKVTYELRPSADRSQPGHDLVRSVTRNLLAAVTPSPEDRPLVSGVEAVEFDCYDGMEWRNYWDTTMTDTNLPSAVRVRLAMSGANALQPFEIVVPIDSQSRTNQ
jgi:type II secretion system protein J